MSIPAGRWLERRWPTGQLFSKAWDRYRAVHQREPTVALTTNDKDKSNSIGYWPETSEIP